MSKEIKAICELKSCDPEDGLALTEVLNIFSGKWKMIIIGSMFDEDIRFSEIQKLIPSITPRMLSKELKDLEMNGLVKRITINSSPILIKYGLTESAKELVIPIKGLLVWAVKNRKISIGL